MKRIVLLSVMLSVVLSPLFAQSTVATPYSEDFNALTAVSGFTSQGFTPYGCSLALSTTASYSCDGTKNLRFYGGGTLRNRVLVFPQFDSEVSTLTLTFRTRPEGTMASPGSFDVGYVTSATDTSTFVALQTYSYSEFSNACLDKEVHFASAPAGARIAMRHRPTSSAFYWYVDDLAVFDATNFCHWPTAAATSALTATGVTIAATDSTGSATAFHLTLDGSDMGAFTAATTLTGLTPNTTYAASVRSLCSADTSDRALSLTFRTRCSATMAAPFFDDMEGHTSGAAPDCYTVMVPYVNGSSVFPRAWVNAANAYSDSTYLRFQGKRCVLAMPTVALAADQMHVTFRMAYSGNYGGTLRCGVVTDAGDTATFIPLYTVTSGGTAYTEHEFWTDGVAADTAYVAFWWTSTNVSGACLIDDIRVELADGCRRPTTAAISAYTDSSVTLQWTAPVSYYGFQVACATTNSVGAATVVDVNDTTYTFGGLSAVTDYWFWVRTLCSDTSAWLPLGSVRTACVPAVAVPLTVTFSAADAGTLPICWTPLQTLTYISIQDESFRGFGPVLQFTPFYGGSTAVAMPRVMLPADSIAVTVVAAIDFTDSASLEVGYVTDLASAATFTALGAVHATAMTTYEFSTAGIPATVDTLWLAFRATATSAQTGYAYIRSIVVDALPPCQRPAAVTVDSVGSAAAVVSWRSTDATAYQLAIGTAADVDSATLYTFSDTTGLVTGLAAATTYHLWVRSVCGDDYSPWRQGPDMTTTACDDYCTVSLTLTDNDYGGQLFLYANLAVTVSVGGTPRLTLGGSTTSDSVLAATLQVCPADTLAFVLHGDYYYDISGIFSSASYAIADGSGAVVASGNGAGIHDGDTFYILADPCPSCLPATALVLDTALTTDSSLTVGWTPPAGSDASWLVYLDGTLLDNVTDTTYTFSGLLPNSGHSVAVAALCSIGDTSRQLSLTAATACAGDECEVQVDMSTLHEHNVAWGSGNALLVYSGATLRAATAVPNGQTTATAYIAVCDGDTLTLAWHAGDNGYGNACGIVALGARGDTIYNGTGRYADSVLATAVVQCGNCRRPDSVALGAVTATSATLTWNATGAAYYLVRIGDSVTATTDTTFTATGLNPVSLYAYSVRAVCAADSSLDVGGTFTTACGAHRLPYSEDFENTAGGQRPDCWSAPVEYPDYYGTMTPAIYRASSQSHSGFNSLELSGIGATWPMAVGPALTGVPVDELYVTFYAKGTAYTGFDAGIMTDPADTATFVPLLSRVNIAQRHVRYEFTTAGLTLTDTVYHVAIRYHSRSSISHDLYVDDLEVRQMPTCSEVFENVVLTSLRTDSVTLSWQVGVGLNAGANYTVRFYTATGDVTDSVIVAAPPLTVGGLTPGHTYRLTVSLNCGGTTAAVSDMLTFTTPSYNCLEPVVDSVAAGEDWLTVFYSTAADSVEVALCQGPFDATAPSTVVAAAASYTATGLERGTAYTIALRAHCSAQSLSGWTLTEAATATTTPCPPPADLHVTAQSYTSIEMAWTPAGDETAWQLHAFNAMTDTTLTVTTNPYAVTGLTVGRTYSFSIRALCGSMADIPGAWSDTLQAATDDCMPVTGVTVADITANGANVSWQPVGGSVGYKLYYGDSAFYDNEATTAVTAPGATAYAITGLQPATAYEVYVLNRCGDAIYSGIAEGQRVLFHTAAGGNGIADIDGGTLTLFPNPAGSSVTVSWEMQTGSWEVEILDLTGKRISALSTRNSELTIDVTSLPSGTYFVRVTASGMTAVRKLIVR